MEQMERREHRELTEEQVIFMQNIQMMVAKLLQPIMVKPLVIGLARIQTLQKQTA